MLKTHWAAILLVLIASVRIISTYHPLSHTTDEPAHLAAGMQYLETGKYLYEDQHPPLARLIGAIGLHLAGVEYGGDPYMYAEGWHELGEGHRYRHNLFYARLAMLPLFWLACAVVFRWTTRIADQKAALFALAIFTLIPAVLGHAGLATTDFALTAFLGAAMLASVELKDTPDLKHALVLGLFIALAVLSKFSALVFLPFVMRWNLKSLRWLPAVLGVAAFVIASGYLFDLRPFFSGLRSVRLHNSIGHLSFLLGRVSQSGFRYYYPVIIAFKTPLAVLILLCFSRQWSVLAAAAAIVAVSIPAHINIGIRHILPIFIPLAICAGIAASRLPRAAAAVLLVWLAVSGAMVHPDYISYTNELAGRHPENILVDSDLDWEQGLSRLNDRLKQLHVDHVHLRLNDTGYFIAGNDFVPYDFPPNSDTPPHGWTAVAITPWRTTGQPKWAAHATPRERIAHSILLYWFP